MYTYVYLKTGTSHDNSNQIYQKRGWTVVGSYNYPVGTIFILHGELLLDPSGHPAMPDINRIGYRLSGQHPWHMEDG